MTEKISTPDEVIDTILDKYGIENDNQLAIKLGVERQYIRGFRNGKGTTITFKLLCAVLNNEL